MNMKNSSFLRAILAFTLLLLIPSVGYMQQSKLAQKANQFLNKEQFDEIIEYLENADEQTKNEDVMYDYFMGMAYFYTPRLKKDALPFIEKYCNAVSPDHIEEYGHHHVYYLLGQMYHLKYQFDKAEAEYSKFISLVNDSKLIPDIGKEQITEQAKLNIEQCKFGKIVIANPRNVVIESLGDSINTEYSEYASVVSQDETKLIFTSRRPDTKGGKKAKDGDYFEDIYSAELVKGSLFENKVKISDSTRGKYFNLVTDFEYQNFRQLGKEVNSSDHDGSIQLDKDDKTLYYYHKSDIWKIDIESEEKDGAEAEKLGLHVNSDQHEPSIFFSYDGQKLFIVSDRSGGYGGLDIYVSDRISDEEWSAPRNLGPKVNTAEDEDAPYLDPDEKTLYFSSKGHSSMGGFDIFRTSGSDTLWSPPVNIGFPVNTPADDIYFTMTERYNRGYYASSDLNGRGAMDLYRITFADERDPVAELLGLVKKGNDFVPAKSKITLKTVEGDEVISDQTDTLSGDYFLLLGHGKKYKMVVETDEFVPYEHLFEVPEQLEYFQLYQEVHHIHLLDKDGQIIGQQITVYTATGTDTKTEIYDDETTTQINAIRDQEDITGDINANKEIKFYLTQDSLRKIMIEDTTLDFDVYENVDVYFLKDEAADKFKYGSYELYSGSLSRKDFLKEDNIAIVPDDTPEGTTAVESIEELFFTVQIGVYSRDVPHSVMFNLKPIITKKTSNNLFRYSTGTFSSIPDAEVRRQKIIDIGVTDAYVTAYYKGERISITRAKELIAAGAKVTGGWSE